MAYKCNSEYELFKDCKHRRDAMLFSRIKEWEADFYGAKNKFDQQNYLLNLERKLGQCKRDYDRIPQASAFSNKMWRYKSDIQQLEWRIKNIKDATKDEGPKLASPTKLNK
eukprot:TRINITY_DN9555_c0_g1_i2.p2 TRINITY_DN9555_c0_g1~~TRINITY_DN9555_c0_g1_i2.p2  ORF type:complete len:111 (+),score=18.80 TRINITY_DN9555_c0_g1_i2:212-544(+)